MLVLSRRLEEKIAIEGGITITVLEIRAGRVKIGVEAPEDVVIWRTELAERPEQRAA